MAQVTSYEAPVAKRSHRPRLPGSCRNAAEFRRRDPCQGLGRAATPAATPRGVVMRLPIAIIAAGLLDDAGAAQEQRRQARPQALTECSSAARSRPRRRGWPATTARWRHSKPRKERSNWSFTIASSCDRPAARCSASALPNLNVFGGGDDEDGVTQIESTIRGLRQDPVRQIYVYAGRRRPLGTDRQPRSAHGAARRPADPDPPGDDGLLSRQCRQPDRDPRAPRASGRLMPR